MEEKFQSFLNFFRENFRRKEFAGHPFVDFAHGRVRVHGCRQGGEFNLTNLFLECRRIGRSNGKVNQIKSIVFSSRHHSITSEVLAPLSNDAVKTYS
jgi:hypothetical protein